MPSQTGLFLLAKIWNFFYNTVAESRSHQVVLASQPLHAPLDRCRFPLTLGDLSGSMCVHWSNLGKKVNGSLLKQEGGSNKLLLIWVTFHGRRKTPLLIHENVRNFDTEYLVCLLASFGYKLIGTILTTGADCGLVVNNRKRKILVLSQYEHFYIKNIQSMFFASISSLNIF